MNPQGTPVFFWSVYWQICSIKYIQYVVKLGGFTLSIHSLRNMVHILCLLSSALKHFLLSTIMGFYFWISVYLFRHQLTNKCISLSLSAADCLPLLFSPSSVPLLSLCPVPFLCFDPKVLKKNTEPVFLKLLESTV